MQCDTKRIQRGATLRIRASTSLLESAGKPERISYEAPTVSLDVMNASTGAGIPEPTGKGMETVTSRCFSSARGATHRAILQKDPRCVHVAILKQYPYFHQDLH